MGLGIAVKSDPEIAHTDQQNFGTRLELEIDEWDELFINVLHAPVEIHRLAGDDREAFLDRRERLFLDDLTNKGYAMLGRIWYVFRDVYYSLPEIENLLVECLKLQGNTENPKALSALAKLAFACRKALRVKSGIFLACD